MTKTRQLELGRLDAEHRDHELLHRLEVSLYRHAGGQAKFDVDVPMMLRRAIDEVIDSTRSQRFLLSELEKTEKTYIGTKIEILFRNLLKLDPGVVLDLRIDGIETDVKSTIGSNWTIPSEALGHPCLLISANERTSTCNLGLIVIREEILNAGRNRDGKTTIQRGAWIHGHWLLRDHPYPTNFWEGLSPQQRAAIIGPRGGTERLAMLFRLHQRRPISRDVIAALGHQLDPMKRLRRNGGARDLLVREGIALLTGKAHRDLIAALGLPFCSPLEAISIQPASDQEKAILEADGELS